MPNLDISSGVPLSVTSAPPTTGNTSGIPRRHPINGREEQRPMKTDFLCRVKYSNALPDIPFDTKFLACPFVSLGRFTDYKSSSLEKHFKFELLCEPDCGVSIDLINPETYYIDPEIPKKHHPIDLELLEDEQANPQNLRRSLQHSKMVPWMRKTEYISSEFTRFGVSAERQETKIGYSTKKKFQSDVLYRDRASQMAAINKTFDDASKPVLQHPTKKGVTAVEELPLLPDFENWMHPFALVVFDGDPIPQSEKVDAQTLMPQALIRGMMDEEGEQFVTYFLPSKETLEKRMKDAEEGVEFDPDYVYEYQSVRDYNWLVRNKSTKGYEQDNFLFSFRDGAVYYNELETKVSLNRRKIKRMRQETKLMVRNRAYDENELASQQDRLNNLLHPYDEKDDEGSEQGSSEGGSVQDHEEKEGAEETIKKNDAEDDGENESDDDETSKGLKVGDASSGEEEKEESASEDAKSDADNDGGNDDDGDSDSNDGNNDNNDDDSDDDDDNDDDEDDDEQEDGEAKRGSEKSDSSDDDD